MNTKAQDGPDLWEQMLAGSVQCPSTLRTLTALSARPCDSKFWSEVDGMFAEVDYSWY